MSRHRPRGPATLTDPDDNPHGYHYAAAAKAATDRGDHETAKLLTTAARLARRQAINRPTSP